MQKKKYQLILFVCDIYASIKSIKTLNNIVYLFKMFKYLIMSFQNKYSFDCAKAYLNYEGWVESCDNFYNKHTH